MREVTISREPHRLSGPLSAKIAQIRTRFRHARSSDIAIDPAEMDAIFANLDEMVGEARTLEAADRQPETTAVAFDLVCQVEDELKVLRSLLTEMTHSPAADAGDQVRCAFARARARLEKGEAVFLGRRS